MSLMMHLWVASSVTACFFSYAAASQTPSPALPRVQVVVARSAATAPDIAIPGDIQARYQSNKSFRVGGRISERLIEVGQRVSADQVIARLEPEQQRANVRDAEAALASAKASADQAKVTLARQQELMRGRFTTQTLLEQAEKQAQVMNAEVEASEARLSSALEQLSYTDLKPGVTGIVTARNGEVGQVVKPGDTIFSVAQDGDRDAVFNVYERLVASPPSNNRIAVSLIADPTVRTSAIVREISPTVDAKSGAVRIKATLEAVPPGMTLGSAVLGRAALDATQAVSLPWGALYRWRGRPAVWIVDPANDTVSPRPISIESYADGAMVLGGGVADGERVVTAGIQFLHPGKKVMMVEGGSP